jgi:hypothetical protein
MNHAFKRAVSAASLTFAAALAFAPVLPVHADTNETSDTTATTTGTTTSTDTTATSETLTHISFTGQLQELSSTDLPTTIVVRVNPTGTFTDYTVDIPAGAEVKPTMSSWITGDSVSVNGTLNDNTRVVTAETVKDVSFSNDKQGMNGWVKAIDATASTMTVTWQGKDTVLKVTSNTHLVVPPKNPATLADFQVNDRVRVRLVPGTTTNEAAIIVALRRGDDIFLKARTRPFEATLNAVDQTAKTLTVTLGDNPGLRGDDVNNLVGVKGEIVTVSFDDSTKFVRRFKGTASADELTAGDTLFIVGRVNDDGTITARTIKDESIFKKGVARQVGTIESVDTAGNAIKVKLADAEWTVTYTDATVIWKDGKKATEADLAAGDSIRVEGVADANTKTVAATKIDASSTDFHPKTRDRGLSNIVEDRIKTSLGKEHDSDIVDHQEPADAEGSQD